MKPWTSFTQPSSAWTNVNAPFATRPYWENYNLLLPLARFGQLAKCVQCYIGQICPSIHWTDLAIDKWHNMSTHRKDLILLYLLPSSFSPPPPPPPSLSPPLSLSDLLHATVISLQYYFTYITFYLITFELSEI